MEIKNINFKVTQEEHNILRLWCLKEMKSLRTLFMEIMLEKAKEKVFETKL